MLTLDLKIPPLLLAVFVAFLMWLVTQQLPVIGINAVLAATLGFCVVIAGLICIVAGVMQFRASSTTVNPTRPDAASALVTSGIYAYTRNPMYVGMGLMLVGWGIWLCSLYALLLPTTFVLYMNRFQIGPEEKALRELFGPEFLAYKDRVRRWL